MRLYLLLALSFIFSPCAQAQDTLVAGAQPDVAELLVDYFDGLRAWELGEKPVAVGMWLKAAGWGDIRAMQRLGSLYETGDNIPQDADLAYFWSSLAARGGLASAETDSTRLRKKISSDRLASLDESIKRWKAIPLDPKMLEAPGSSSNPALTKPTGKELISALESADLATFTTALAGGVSAQTETSDGVEIIFLASASGKPTFVKALVDAGASPNVVLPNGMTPLHFAAAVGNRDIVDLLIAKGASAALQDRNGVWPSDVAKQKGYLLISEALKKQQDRELVEPINFLLTRGYFPEKTFDDIVARDKAVRMYQQGQSISVTGVIDQPTIQALNNDAKNTRAIKYEYVIRYKKGGSNWYKASGAFHQTVADARSYGMKLCEKESGTDCKFNFTPQGGCIAVAKPPSGSFRVAKPQLTEADASADALSQCAADTDGCKISTTRCAKD